MRSPLLVQDCATDIIIKDKCVTQRGLLGGVLKETGAKKETDGDKSSCSDVQYEDIF